MRHLTRAAVLAAALALAAGTAAAQEARTLEFPLFHAELEVARDGTLTVTETIRIHFIGSWNGLLREIPVEYQGEHGENYTLLLDMRSVTDSAGAPLQWESERNDGKRLFRVWVPGAQNATRTVVLRYVVENGLRFFEEHDELYWNVTGNDSEYRIENASATVHLPAEVTGIRTAFYTGRAGVTGRDGVVTVNDGQPIEFRTTRPLEFREGLTVVAGWDPGVIARPSAWDRTLHFFRSNVPLAVPLLALLGMLLLWRRFGRDPARGSIVPRYEPPGALTPAEAGTLIDNSPDMRDVTATLVDLAVRGYVHIEETEEKQLLGLITNRAFNFASKRPASSWTELKPHERALLDSLFDSGQRETVSTKDLENEFYHDLPGIKSHLSDALTSEGHYLHHPNRVRGLFIGIGILIGFAVAVASSIYLTRLGQPQAVGIVAGVLTGAIILGFGLIMPARTIRGVRTLEEILGFEEFLRRVEKDRFERVVRTPELFEKYLPYAMALGVEKSWARAFDDIYRDPPEWYHGPAGYVFVAHAFTDDLGRMATVTGAAMTSAPRSSSGSSGFSGGGFSGGGFGGGSVGGF